MVYYLGLEQNKVSLLSTLPRMPLQSGNCKIKPKMHNVIYMYHLHMVTTRDQSRILDWLFECCLTTYLRKVYLRANILKQYDFKCICHVFFIEGAIKSAQFFLLSVLMFNVNRPIWFYLKPEVYTTGVINLCFIIRWCLKTSGQNFFKERPSLQCFIDLFFFKIVHIFHMNFYFLLFYLL